MKLSALTSSLLILAFISGVMSCKDPSDVGFVVQPAGDAVDLLITDTFSLEVSVIEEDSLRTDESSASLNLLGRYFDPIFGISVSSFYTQIRLPNNNNNFSFGDSPVLDSIVLTLEYKGYYGDSVTQQKVEVYRIDESLQIDSNYFSSSQVITGQQLFSGVVAVNPLDSVDLGGNNRSPHLRLRLNDALGEEFIDDANAGSFVDNDAFVQFFKGLYVKTADKPSYDMGSIAYFNLLASLSKLTVYYSNVTADSLAANFEINGQCPRFSKFDHNYAVSSFGNMFPIPGNDKAYVQSMSGLKTRITIPHLKNIIADGPVAINKAEFIFYVEDNTSKYTPHESAFFLAVDSAGKEILIIDVLESSSYYGGSYNSSDKTIRFNIARHMQRLLSNDFDDYGLSLISVGGSTNARRTVFIGPNRTDPKMYLRLTYSKLN
jgi:Domain of unknown function (DUF4270)